MVKLIQWFKRNACKDWNIKVINAGNCIICGREIKIDTKKENDKFLNIFFCPRCEERIVRKGKAQPGSEE